MKKILGLILALALLPVSVSADTCAVSLMPAFTAAQAKTLCTKFGTSVAASFVPQTDNTYDLGSTSKTWRTLYTGTSRIAKTSDILRVRQDAQRLFTWDGSSDTALTMTFGDAGTTAVQQLLISASTADTDDDSSLVLAGGGASGETRGSSITLQGEEVSGGGDIIMNTGTSDSYSFNVGGTTEATLDGLNFAPGALAGNTLGALALPWYSVFSGTVAIDADITAVTSSTMGLGVAKNVSAEADQAAFIGYGANANGVNFDLFKTRATTTDANTIVVSGDILGQLRFYGADGASYRTGAAIVVKVDNTPGSSDMPGSIDLQTSPDGSATLASVLKLSSDKSAQFTGTVLSSATGSIGWSVQAAANQACNTTCTSACVTGIDTLGTGGFLDCATATADFCLCAGAS